MAEPSTYGNFDSTYTQLDSRHVPDFTSYGFKSTCGNDARLINGLQQLANLIASREAGSRSNQHEACVFLDQQCQVWSTRTSVVRATASAASVAWCGCCAVD